MRLIHNKSFSPDEVEDYRKIVFTNLVNGMRMVIDLMDELNMAVAAPNRRYIQLVDNEVPVNTGEAFPPKYYEALRNLWADPQVQACYAKSYQYALQENMP